MSQRHPGVGQEYEVLLPAYMSLKLYKNPEVEDFGMKSNDNAKLGKFDDLTIRVQKTDKQFINFALQLKHAQRGERNIQPGSFKKSKNFELNKYKQSLKDDLDSNCNYILYTNRNFDPNKFGEVENLIMSRHDQCPGRLFLDTSEDGSVYKFQTPQPTGSDAFYNNFSLYSNQKSLTQIEVEIRNFFKNQDPSNYEHLTCKYIDFFRRWHNREFKNPEINRSDVILLLIDLHISPFTIVPKEWHHRNEKFEYLEDAMKKFHLVVVKNYNSDQWQFRRNISDEHCLELGKRWKIITKHETELTPHLESKISCYVHGRPLIVKFDELSKNSIEHALTLIFENDIKMTIVAVANEDNFDNWSCFANLQDLKSNDESFFNELVTLFKVIYRKDREFSLVSLFEGSPELVKSVTTDDLLLMIDNKFIIKEELQRLPESYIGRKVFKTVFNRTIFDCDNDVFVIVCGGLLDVISEIVRTHPFIGRRSILLQTLPSPDEFENICSKNTQSSVHLLQALTTDSYEWLTTRGNLDNIRRKASSEKITRSEEALVSYQHINLICGLPGIGKTTMMTFLMNKFGSEFWIVRIDLIEHVDCFMTKTADLSHFLKEERGVAEKIKQVLIQEQKVCFFFDGIDEMKPEHVREVIKCINDISRQGFHVWASSRNNLQEFLETELETFAIEIRELDESDRKTYIKNQLKMIYENRQINEIIDEMSNHADVLITPLHLYVVTLAFKNNNKKLFKNIRSEMFILTKMYFNFVRGKCEHFAKKLNCQEKSMYTSGLFNPFLEKYQVLALHSLLPETIFNKLNLQDVCTGHLKKIEEEGDRIGIILKISKEHKSVFFHTSFAEYFAAMWLAKNFAKVPNLEEILYKEEFDNLRFMFDVTLAEENPAHLAVIYEDFQSLKSHHESMLLKDAAGRNCLQVACGYGQRYPRLEKKYSLSKYLTFGRSKYIIKEESPKRIAILKYLLRNKIDPWETDDLFKWNAVTYADKSFNLFAIEMILESTNSKEQLLKSLNNYLSVTTMLYYSAEFGYTNLLRITYDLYLFKNSSYLNLHRYVSNVFSKFGYAYYHLLNMRNIYDESLLHVAISQNHLKIIEVLLQKDVYVTTFNKKRQTPLHLAVIKNKSEIVKLLLENGARAEVLDCEYRSPVYEAISRGYLEILILFLMHSKDNLGSVQDPIHLAAKTGHVNIIKCLLENSVLNLEAFDKNGMTPLHWAMMQHKKSVTDFLLKTGVNPNVPDQRWKEDTPLHFGARHGYLYGVEKLLDAKVDVNLLNKEGETALHLAVINGHLKIVETLIRNDSFINIVDVVKSRTPLHYAVAGNHEEIVDVLLNNNADPNIEDVDGFNALHLLIYQGGSLKIFELILPKICDLNAVDKHGKSALKIAIDKGNEDIIEKLKSRRTSVEIDGFTFINDEN